MCGSVVTDLRTIKSSFTCRRPCGSLYDDICLVSRQNTHTVQFPGCGPVQRYNDVSTLLLDETECGKCGRLVHILIFENDDIVCNRAALHECV